MRALGRKVETAVHGIGSYGRTQRRALASGAAASRSPRALPLLPKAPGNAPFVRTARRLNRASGLLALSVLLDSGLEHYRGGFRNRAMVLPLIVSSLTLAASVHGHGDRQGRIGPVRGSIYGMAALVGVLGTGFHVFNVLKRPNGLAWQNLFYGAPIGAPASLILSGALGVYSEEVRSSHALDPKVFGLPAGRALAALSALGLLGASGEAGLLHYRGAFHDPFMLAPVTLPPAGAGLLAAAAAGKPGRDLVGTRGFLRVLAAMGFAGAGFHALGVARNMGGWRNWSQNLLNGPPLPAPPSFTGLALAGLAALGLMRDHPHA